MTREELLREIDALDNAIAETQNQIASLKAQTTTPATPSRHGRESAGSEINQLDDNTIKEIERCAAIADEQALTKKTFTDYLNFLELAGTGVPAIAQLLGSKTSTDCIEAIKLLTVLE